MNYYCHHIATWYNTERLTERDIYSKETENIVNYVRLTTSDGQLSLTPSSKLLHVPLQRGLLPVLVLMSKLSKAC